MAGLDKILEDIRSESAKAVESVKNEAQAAYNAEMEKARGEAAYQDWTSDLPAWHDQVAADEKKFDEAYASLK